MVKPVSPSPQEIKQVAWLPLDEFLGSKYYAKGLYGSLLKTAAGPAQAAAREVMSAGKTSTPCGFREVKMTSKPGLEESLFFAGHLAKL